MDQPLEYNIIIHTHEILNGARWKYYTYCCTTIVVINVEEVENQKKDDTRK